jgi:hypothetical protein
MVEDDVLVLVRLDHIARFIVNANHGIMSGSKISRSQLRLLVHRTKADRMAAHRKSNRPHVDLCAVEFRKRVVSCSSRQASGWRFTQNMNRSHLRGSGDER